MDMCSGPVAPVMGDPERCGAGSKEDALFDASQYAFFGNDLVEEVELGGLEDVEGDLPALDFEEEEFLFGRENFNNVGIGIQRVVDDCIFQKNSFASEMDGEDLSLLLNYHEQDTSRLQNGKANLPKAYSSTCRPSILHQQLLQQQQQQQLHVPLPNNSSSLYQTWHPPFSSPNHPQSPNLTCLASSLPISHLQLDSLGLYSSHLLQNGLIPPVSSFSSNHHPPRAHDFLLLPASPPALMSRVEPALGCESWACGRRQNGTQRSRNNCYPSVTYGGWPRFRAMRMLPSEIDNIIRIHLAATHSNDPYVDDYHHQACLAKKSACGKARHHFSPTSLGDHFPRPRATTHPPQHTHHAQADALGRATFSSIHGPRHLIEIDTSREDPAATDLLKSAAGLESMAGVRLAIENGFCRLNDVIDIDRFAEFNQFDGCGVQLIWKRQTLLEELAVSLRLVDPVRDDQRFLRLASLPKGIKLFARFLRLLHPGTSLLCVVCAAVFRHSWFLFGTRSPSNLRAPETTRSLAAAASSCVSCMDLASLASCISALLSSSDPSPLLSSSTAMAANPFSLLSVLQRATQLLDDGHNSRNYNLSNLALWKASFDEFFRFLIKYCVTMCDAVMQSSTPEPAEALKKELPLELLRASIPLADHSQRRLLYDLSQRSLVSSHLNKDSVQT